MWQTSNAPRSGTDLALFLALARRNGVLKKFYHGSAFANPHVALIWHPDDIRAEVLKEHPSITAAEYDAAVRAPMTMPDNGVEHPAATYDARLERMLAFLTTYAEFHSRAYEIWLRGRSAFFDRNMSR